MTRRFIGRAALVVALVIYSLVPTSALTTSALQNQSPRPPSQPESGPGGKQYAHSAVTKNRFGIGGEEYWIFEPDSPKPKSAPLVVFIHGWGGMNPLYYGAWLDHLVKRGNIVIYPRYQAGLLTPVREFSPNTIRAIKSAIARLESDSAHIKPDLKKFAVVGHSMGGLLAANVAALASESGLPEVRAVMSVEPGISEHPVNFPLADLKKIPSATLLLAIAGDQDTLVADKDAKRIYLESTRVPAANKDFITLVTDDRGMPALRGSHRAPTAPDPSYDNGEGARGVSNRVGGSSPPQNRRGEIPAIDAMDFYGTWKLFDGLCDAAFYGKNREYALDNTPQQRFMGKWSDGVAVKELKVTDTP
jgi:pimeloyl-ACP methyl ester carboxylesterase